ncbi:MAG: DUF1016 N-terminal domain-containing protein [Clostridia bacterium]
MSNKKLILNKIEDFYSENLKPSNEQLMQLYTYIGKIISSEDKRGFIANLANLIKMELPNLKGFSPRNLRRMRDFYQTYKCDANLLNKAEKLNWTQNIVILELCKSNEERDFYLEKALNESISKLKLIELINSNLYEEELAKEQPICATVREFLLANTNTTSSMFSKVFNSIVSICEKLCKNKNSIFRPSNCFHIVNCIFAVNVLKYI